MKTLANLKSVAKSFYNDEDGLEAIQVVMIVAIAAVILVGLMALFNGSVSTWIMEKVEELTGESSTGLS